MDAAKLLDIDHLRATGAVPHFFGLGFVQLKLNDTERMHFYHPEAGSIHAEEEVHDHRYGFTSWVLRGALNQWTYRWSPGCPLTSNHEMFEVSCKPGEPADPKPLDSGWLHPQGEMRFATGSHYSIRAGDFHRVQGDRAVTFLRRDRDRRIMARVIRLKGAPAICAFSAPKPEAECWEIIADLLGDDHG